MRPGASHVARPGMLTPLCKNMYLGAMASPYATLAGVLRGDETNLREVFFDHTSRHRCPADSGCEARRVLTDALASVRAMLARDADRGQEVGAT